MTPTTTFKNPIARMALAPMVTTIEIESAVAARLFALYQRDNLPGVTFAQWLNRFLNDAIDQPSPFELLYGVGATPEEFNRD